MIEHAMAEPSGLFFELMMGDGEMARCACVKYVWSFSILPRLTHHMMPSTQCCRCHVTHCMMSCVSLHDVL